MRAKPPHRRVFMQQRHNEERPKKGLGGITPAQSAKRLVAERSYSHRRTLNRSATEDGGTSDQPPVPAEHRVRRNDACHLTQDPPAEFLASRIRSAPTRNSATATRPMISSGTGDGSVTEIPK